jgi:hypothetical protein
MDRVVKITTLRATDVLCPDTRSCPSIHAVAGEPDRRYVITKRVTDPAVATAFAHLVADDEQLGYVPADLLPEV